MTWAKPGSYSGLASELLLQTNQIGGLLQTNQIGGTTSLATRVNEVRPRRDVSKMILNHVMMRNPRERRRTYCYFGDHYST